MNEVDAGRDCATPAWVRRWGERGQRPQILYTTYYMDTPSSAMLFAKSFFLLGALCCSYVPDQAAGCWAKRAGFGFRVEGPGSGSGTGRRAEAKEDGGGRIEGKGGRQHTAEGLLSQGLISVH